MSSAPMFVVTHVAPYPDGPAGVHGVLPQAAMALSEIATLAGLDPRPVTDPAQLDPGTIAGGGVLTLFTIGETPWSAEQRQAILDTVRAGRLGVLAIHSSTDACRAWPEYGALVGARFDGHPWTVDFGIKVVDPGHPATAHLPAGWHWHDEVYLFDELRPDAQVLLEVDDTTLDMSVPDARVPACGFPLSWCFTEGQGRCFYTSLGHFPHSWEYPIYLKHVAGGLDWVLQ